MIRRFLIGTSWMLAFCLSMTSSFAQEVRWQGPTDLISSSGCQDVGAVDNFPAFTTYRAKLKDSEPNSGLLFNFGRGATIIVANDDSSQLDGNGKYKGTAISGSVAFRDTKGSYDFVLTPSVIKKNTKTVTISGIINNFVGKQGCTIEINGTYKKF